MLFLKGAEYYFPATPLSPLAVAAGWLQLAAPVAGRDAVRCGVERRRRGTLRVPQRRCQPEGCQPAGRLSQPPAVHEPLVWAGTAREAMLPCALRRSARPDLDGMFPSGAASVGGDGTNGRVGEVGCGWGGGGGGGGSGWVGVGLWRGTHLFLFAYSLQLEILLQHGARLDAKSEGGFTAREVACSRLCVALYLQRTDVVLKMQRVLQYIDDRLELQEARKRAQHGGKDAM